MGSTVLNVSLYFPQFCFSAEQLVLIYGLADNSSASSGLDRSGLARLSPALVQQILSGACTNSTEPHTSDGLTKAESKCVVMLHLKGCYHAEQSRLCVNRDTLYIHFSSYAFLCFILMIIKVQVKNTISGHMTEAEFCILLSVHK